MSSIFGQSYPLFGLKPAFGTLHEFPLVSSQVHYRIVDVQYHATLRQTYTSKSSQETEVRYTFPLPSDGSVCSYKAIIDGVRTITGIVKNKQQAKKEYDHAIRQGKTATLLEQVNVEVFQVSLGNLRPGQTIEVQIAFVALISQEAGLDSLRITFPTAIGPRYGAMPTTSSNVFTFPSFTHARKAGLDLSISIEMSSPIRSVTSPSHPIATHLGTAHIEAPEVEFDNAKAFVQLSETEWLDKDMVLVVKCAELDRPRCVVERYDIEAGAEEATHAYALTFVPRFDLPPLPKQEFIFLVDRSGSMSGGKMQAVRTSLQIMLKSLPTRNTLFNIFSFGSAHSKLWETSRPYTAESVANASQHVDQMEANYGGTEIRTAIEAGIASSRNAVTHLDETVREGEDPVPTSLFVLTDGESWDLDAVVKSIRDKVDAAKEKKSLLRIFVLGIGNAVSRAMCEGIARSGQGVSVFVGEKEKPDHKLMGLLRAARGAPIENIAIDWGVELPESNEATAAVTPSTLAGDDDFHIVQPEPPRAPISLFDTSFNPSQKATEEAAAIGAKPIQLPPPPALQVAPDLATLSSLYPGFRTSIFAIAKRPAPSTRPSAAVTVRGTLLGHAVELSVPVSATQAEMEVEGVKMVHVLAARALIQSIEDGKGEKAGAAVMTEVEEAKVRRLGLRYKLASSQTSFVAVDEEGAPLISRQPLPPQESDMRPLLASAGFSGTTTGFGQPAAPMAAPLAFGAFGGGPVMTSSGPFGHATSQMTGGGTFTFGSSMPSTGAFGSAAPSGNPPPSSSSAFGSSNRSSVASTGFFGQAATPMLFGNAAPAPQTTGFGGSSPSFAYGSTLGLASTTGFEGGRGSGQTLFGASSPSPTFSQQQQQQHQQPVTFTGGRGAFGGFSSSGLQQAMPGAAQGLQMQHQMQQQQQSAPSVGLFGRPSSGTNAFGGGGLFGSSLGPPPTSMAPTSTESLTVAHFARLQSFDGAFGPADWLNGKVWRASLPAFPHALGSFSLSTDVETLWRTLLCVAFLEVRLKEDRNVWEVMVDKALDYVRGALQSAQDSEALLRFLRDEAAKNIIAK